MGNGAVGADNYALDAELAGNYEAVEKQKPKSPRPTQISGNSGKLSNGDTESVTQAQSNSDGASVATKNTKNTTTKQQVIDKLNYNGGDNRSRDKKSKFDEKDDLSEISDSEDLEPVEVLLQFIPYYGQGDPANDSIVRSTLSSLSVEDIDSKDEFGNTLLLLACQYRCEDLVRIMLNKGADPNALNHSGACGLHFACYQESASINIAKVLLKNGANPDVAETTYGCTPLHYCAGNGDKEFCKLLLSYGSQLNSVDYYNYTCVDYAREAGHDELSEFLQNKLDKVNAQNQARNGLTAAKSMRFPKATAAYDDMSEWESHVDPESGSKYYINLRTGECLWETELKERIHNFQVAQQVQQTVTSGKGGSFALSPGKQKLERAESKPKLNEELLMTQATQARLIAFLSTHDPARLGEVDNLLTEYKGREQELLNSLCKQYKVEEDPEFQAFQAKLNELKGTSTSSSNHVGVVLPPGQKVSDVNMIDPFLLQDVVQDARKKFEMARDEEVTEMKRKFDQQVEEERGSYRLAISEKEGLIVKLQTEVETLQRLKSDADDEIQHLQSRMGNLQMSEGEAMTQLERELQQLKDENSNLKAQLQALRQDLHAEKEKLTSLESTLSNLHSGKEEMIERERAAAEERAEYQRVREMQFANEIKEVETKAKNVEMKLKSDLNQTKNEMIRLERQSQEEFEQMKKGKERDIESLRRELAERKAQFAQEISAAMMQVEDTRKLADEASKRAEEAEQFQKLVQNEIAEAKMIQKYNAQLHKDLQREQVARKKLHNDMEDLKGKIRVYVRIRPYSNSEKEKNCQEAVFKDGKMTVCVKGVGGPDAKKFYDFDQVFGGSEGNTQADVFKDTKHLIMSVIDGYNVCIFAYGQTGAGKSYTMIGGADIGACMSADGEFDDSAGVIPRAISELFRLLNERTAQVEYVVEVQMFQLYRDGLEDLLKEKRKKKKDDDDMKDKDPPLKITLAEHSPTGLVNVEGAETMVATTPGEVIRILAKGSSRRTTASTQMNAESSRSHLICSLVVKLTNRRSGTSSIGKLTLVDLAGSERVDKSGASGEQLKEAQSINKSLSALGDVISALTTGSQHIPYRNHPLTMLMSDSIGGNAKTLMFVNTSPADYNNTESNNSLAFASRCKDITNMVAAGPGVQAAQMNALKKELAKLKKGGGGGAQPKAPPIQTLARPDTSAGSRK